MQRKIYLLHALFLFPMWISKTLQPLYWESEGKLTLFSYSYVAMAVAGAFSILYSVASKKIGIRNSLFIGYFLYGIGLILRAYPENVLIAIITGFIAGVGASITGITLGALILKIDGKDRRKVILQTDNISTLSQSLGAMLSGLLVSSIMLYLDNGYKYSLIITGLMTLAGVLFIPKNETSRSNIGVDKNKEHVELIKKTNNINILIFSSCFIQGVCWAVFIPLVPVYLKNIGYSINLVGLILSSGVMLGLVLKNIYIIISERKGKKHSLILFTVLTVVSLWFSLIFLSAELKFHFAISIIIFYSFKTIMSLLLNFIEMNIAEKSGSISIFGVRQTAFLIGDIVGGIIMPYVFDNKIIINYPILIIVLILISSILINACNKVAEGNKWS